MACCYSGCYNTRKKNPDLTFFRFPKERERCHIWLRKCDNNNILKLSFSELQYRVVCEEHFSSKCFDVSRLTSGKTRRSLFKFACPQPSSVIAALEKEEELKKGYRQTALVEAPPFPSRLQRDAKVADLASPKLLMSMTENICPMIRPISPNLLDNNEENEEQIMSPLFVSTLSSQILPPLSPLQENPSDPSYSATNHSAIVPDLKRKSPKASNTKLVKRRKIKKFKHCNRNTVKICTAEENEETPALAPERGEEISDGGCSTISPSTRRYKKILPKTEKLNERIENMEKLTGLLSSKKSKLKRQNHNKSSTNTTTLNLDHGSLETLPKIENYESLTEISLANNKIHNLIWFLDMTQLKILKLSNNCISNVEALSKLTNLNYVDLSGNKINSLLKFKPKPESNLEYLNLSNNQITEITFLTNLVHLKDLLVHENKISSIKHWSNLLPYSIKTLTLDNNNISNLHDFSELHRLDLLESLTVYNNPCLHELITIDKTKITMSPKSFNYVPYILYWCRNLAYINGIEVHQVDSLKAKQLISEGLIGTFKPEDTGKLINYLSEACSAQKVVSSQDELGDNPSQVTSTTSSIVGYLITSKNTQSHKFNDDFVDHPVNNHLPANKRKEKNNTNCTVSSCPHYIELIEEKARSHKLQRTNEEFCDRIQLLEAMLIQNGISVTDVNIKIEAEEEEI